MKIGLLFAGQGAQYPGMGRDLYEKSEAARKVFDEAGEQIKDWCFNGTKEMLRQTRITQPCIYTVAMAAYQALLESVSGWGGFFWEKAELAGLAGFSLGEYAALTAGGVIGDIGKGLEIVSARGELMLKAGSDEEGNSKGGMVAAFGSRHEIQRCVEEARGDGILEGVNFNSQVQTAVAGDLIALERFKKTAAANKIKTIPLTVSTAFHCPMMAPAVEPMRRILLEAGLKAPTLKVYCNLTGDDILGGQRLPEGDAGRYLADVMARQIKSPVYWQETIENMAKDGIGVLIELGPGTTLCGMVKKISHDIVALNVEDGESLAKTVRAMAEMTGAKGDGMDA